MALTRDRIPQGWDEAAVTYDKIAFPVTSQYAREAVDMLGVSPGDRVLDVAAGSGAATFAAIQAGADVVATDFAPKMVELLHARARESGMTLEALVMDGQSLEFPDSTFDKVISVFGLIFFPERGKGMSEMFRVLKPGGSAAIVSWSTPERTWPISFWGSTLYELMPELPRPTEPPAVYSLSDPDRFEDEMKQAGFSGVTITPIIHTFPGSSPQQFWDDFHAASPVFTMLGETLGDRIGEYEEAIIEKLREKGGDGKFEIDSEALVAIGTKE